MTTSKYELASAGVDSTTNLFFLLLFDMISCRGKALEQRSKVPNLFHALVLLLDDCSALKAVMTDSGRAANFRTPLFRRKSAPASAALELNLSASMFRCWRCRSETRESASLAVLGLPKNKHEGRMDCRGSSKLAPPALAANSATPHSLAADKTSLSSNAPTPAVLATAEKSLERAPVAADAGAALSTATLCEKSIPDDCCA